MEYIELKSREVIHCRSEQNIKTLLYSGMVLCIWDETRHSGGMVHFPDSLGKKDEENLLKLLREFKRSGSTQKDLRLKIVGNNISETVKDTVLHTLGNFNLQAVNEEYGQENGKEIVFNSKIGSVKFRPIRDQEEYTTRFDQPEEVHVAENTVQDLQKKIKVLIVDDAKTIRIMLRKIVEKDPNCIVVGEAENPIIAKEIIESKKPDVVTLDIHMPEMDGLSFLETYLSKKNIHTIIISNLAESGSKLFYRSLELGAFDCLKKPSIRNMDSESQDIIDLIKAAYHSHKKIDSLEMKEPDIVKIRSSEILNSSLIVIGASTGGPVAINKLLARMPRNIPPIVIVQHIPKEFSKLMADRLDSETVYNVEEAKNSRILKNNCVYIAPGGIHLKLKDSKQGVMIELVDDEPYNHFKPSVDFFFHSVAKLKNKNIVSVILTGMGDDGARGLLDLKNEGCYTIAQDEGSCLVFGMPKEAIAMGAACEVTSLNNIPYTIVRAFNKIAKSA
mgnify:CR=1 FL=1